MGSTGNWGLRGTGAGACGGLGPAGDRGWDLLGGWGLLGAVARSETGWGPGPRPAGGRGWDLQGAGCWGQVQDLLGAAVGV